MRRRRSGHGDDRGAPQLTDGPPGGELVLGRAGTRLSVVLAALFFGAVFPGFVGSIAIVLGIGDSNQGAVVFGVVWCLAWMAFAVAVEWWRREYRLVGANLQMRNAFRVWTTFGVGPVHASGRQRVAERHLATSRRRPSAFSS